MDILNAISEEMEVPPKESYDQRSKSTGPKASKFRVVVTDVGSGDTVLEFSFSADWLEAVAWMVPVLSGKDLGQLAQEMKEGSLEDGVPIFSNVDGG